MAHHAGESKGQSVDRSRRKGRRSRQAGTTRAVRGMAPSARLNASGSNARRAGRWILWTPRYSKSIAAFAATRIAAAAAGDDHQQRAMAELMDALGADLPPSARRANLMVSGLDLKARAAACSCVGDARLKINGETRPCEQMEEAHPGLEELMRERWGGGVFAEVLDGGEIRVGDGVEWDPAGVTLFEQTATIR